MREIGHFDPPQMIKFSRVLEQHLLMLQTANESEIKHGRENSPIHTTTKIGKNDGVESGVRERRRSEKSLDKKKEQEGAGHHTTPPQEDAK